MNSVDNVWIVFFCIISVHLHQALSKECPPLTPPSSGLLKCQNAKGFLQCLATCFNGQEFDTGEKVVARSCDEDTGHWMEGDSLPVCQNTCKRRLMTEYSDSRNQVVVTASSDVMANDVIPLAERTLLGNRWTASWRPEVDNLAQFIQVELPSLHRINGIVLQGDGSSDYVTSFRLLFSVDGTTWYPYSSGESKETFLGGNTNSRDATIVSLHCPHEARYVRVNPITWSGHVALTFDLIGCPVEPPILRCHLVAPPQGGVVNCEVDGKEIFCTAYCEKGKVFEGTGNKPVISTSCNDTFGYFDVTQFPPCVDGESPSENVSVFCMEEEPDCDHVTNGDYQYCGDCHYFSTCSHGYFYVRACPALLQFDSIHRLCDYKSTTCSSFKRRYWLAERKMQSYIPKF